LRAKGSRPKRSRRDGVGAAELREISALHDLAVAREELRTQSGVLLETQRALDRALESYFELFDAAAIPCFTTDLDGVILEINLTGKHLLARAGKDLTGIPLLMLVVPADRRRFLEQLAACRAQPTLRSVIVRLKSPTGVAVPVRMTLRHNRRGFHVVAHDATEDARIERERAVLESERRRIEQREAVMLAASEARDRSLAVLSHELRAPLAPILAAVSALAAQPDLAVEVRPLLEVIRRNVAVEAHLIDDLLDVSRIEQGRLALQLEIVDLHDVILEAASHMNATLVPAREPVELDLHASRNLLSADRTRLRQVLWNLLDNASRATSKTGSISIRTEDDALDHVLIVVRDSGAGIDPARLSDLFTAFSRVTDGEVNPPGPRSGLGLGLAICKGIVEAHGGRISASSAGRGQGASFEIRLRAHARDGSDVRFPEASPPDDAQLPALPARLRILVVDDHADSADSLAFFLRTLKHDVTVAHTMAEALVRGDERHDVLITDVDLSDGTGFELLARLADGRPRAAIALSGFGDRASLLASARAGFQEHLVKPAKMPALLAAISRALRRCANGEGGTPPHGIPEDPPRA
jgi:signal transduction histidine kinase/ActR/RegA family two-component response regulator